MTPRLRETHGCCPAFLSPVTGQASVLLMHQSWGSDDLGLCEFKVLLLHPFFRRTSGYSISHCGCHVGFRARGTPHLQQDTWRTPTFNLRTRVQIADLLGKTTWGSSTLPPLSLSGMWHSGRFSLYLSICLCQSCGYCYSVSQMLFIDFNLWVVTDNRTKLANAVLFSLKIGNCALALSCSIFPY